MKQSEPPEWLKEIDLARTLENIIVGAILFAGYYFKTFWAVMFAPSRIEAGFIFSPTYKNYVQLSYTRPLSYLAVSGFVYLSFSASIVGRLIPIENLLEILEPFIESLPKQVGDFTLEKIAGFMAPSMAFVALYALVSWIVASQFDDKASFKVHLNIAAYTSGSYALIATAVSALMMRTEPAAWRTDAGTLDVMPLWITALLLWSAMTWCTYRYVYFLKHAGKHSWLIAIIIGMSTFLAFTVVSYCVLFAIQPFSEALRK